MVLPKLENCRDLNKLLGAVVDESERYDMDNDISSPYDAVEKHFFNFFPPCDLCRGPWRVGPILHPLATLTLPLPSPARLFIGLTDDVILPRGSIIDVVVPELTIPFIYRNDTFLIARLFKFFLFILLVGCVCVIHKSGGWEKKEKEIKAQKVV